MEKCGVKCKEVCRGVGKVRRDVGKCGGVSHSKKCGEWCRRVYGVNVEGVEVGEERYWERYEGCGKCAGLWGGKGYVGRGVEKCWERCGGVSGVSVEGVGEVGRGNEV